MSLALIEHARDSWPAILAAAGVESELLVSRGTACPVCGGDDRFTFDDARGMGTWHCRGCDGGRAGKGMDLLMAVKACNYSEAAKHVESIIGRAEPKKAPDRNKYDPSKRLREIAKESRQRYGDDPASLYLANRGIRGFKNPDVRYHPSLDYYTNEGRRLGAWPAMIALVRTPAGEPATWHATYLDYIDGSWTKASLGDNPSKKLLATKESLRGAAIRLCGASGRHLEIGEGIETSLSAALMHNQPAWAVISTSGMKSFSPPEGVEAVTLLADRDANFAGHAAAYTGAHALSCRGIRCRVLVAEGGDFNDDLLASMEAP